MKRLVVTLILFVGVSLAFSSEISGQVVDQTTGQPISNAEIILKPMSLKATNSADGFFKFEKLNKGHFEIQIIHPSYLPLKKGIDLKEGEKADFRFEIRPLEWSEQMTVSATRAVEGYTPVVFTDVSRETIAEEHTVEDVPMLLVGMPNVYSYSDDGSGVGYSYLKIRGFDQTRIGVMINGVPLNDPEDHQVYWVDMPDFAESLESIQVQRGVGTSLYGVDTFGGSVNLITTGKPNEEGIESTTYAGSYGTAKLGLQGQVSLRDDWHLIFRGSYLTTDGYRENSGGEQWSAYLGLTHYGERSVTRFITYTGNELTHAAWEASAQSVLAENHRDNPIEYENTIDNFSQPHYELHHTVLFSDQLYWKNTLFAIQGKGYYEQYKYGRDMYEYGLWDDPSTSPSADIIRQKWVKKSQYGWVSELGWSHPNGQLTFGSYISTYHSNHWGEVDDLIGLEMPSYTPEFVYHRYFSDKDYLTAYVNEIYHINDRTNLMASLHYQKMKYSLDQAEAGNFTGENLHSLEVDYEFLNPRVGLNVNVTDQFSAFANISIAHREPADSELFDTWLSASDFGVAPLFNHVEPVLNGEQIVRLFWTDPQVKEEKLIDYELGMNFRTDSFLLRTNLFWMDFHDEIVPYGQVDDDGFPVRGNADRTVHRGIEVSADVKLTGNWDWSTNVSLNDNYYKTFIYKDYNWDTGGVNEVDFSGNTIAGFPDVVANTTLTFHNDRVRSALRWQYFGDQYLDNTQNQDHMIKAYSLVHAWILYDLPWKGSLDKVELSLRVNNLLDKTYETAGYYDAWAGENYLWPGAERQMMFGLRIKY